MRFERFAIAIATLMALGLTANGIFMQISPGDWYCAVPGVTTTGPFNQHFLRDIGLIFVGLGAAFAAGIMRPALRVPFWGAAAIWLAGHALFHVWEVAVGICGPDALARDFSAVTLPAIIATALTLWSAAHQRSAALMER